ncbi:MAG: leucine-rich repeat protein [Lachnospiraceae bacterium]|nr:leucine-rich repeat protein [Lachnospiraceae bacterium]
MRRFRNVTKCISCMAVALMLCVMSGWFTQEVFAEWGDGEQDGIIYGYDTDFKEAYVYDYEGDATDIVIPETLGGYTVKTIEIHYYGTEVKTISIPSGVIDCTIRSDRIGYIYVDEANQTFKSVDGALYTKDGKELVLYPYKESKELVISEGTETIWDNAMSKSEVETVTLPSTLKYVNIYVEDAETMYQKVEEYLADVLPSSQMLRDVYVSEDNENIVSVDGIVYSKDMKRLVFCPRGKSGEITVDERTDIIGHEAFSESKVTKITLPEGLTSIEYSAFSNCTNLTELNIPKGVTEFNKDMFWKTALKSLTFPEDSPYISENGIVYNKDKTELLFAIGYINGKLVIPEGVKSIGRSAFEQIETISEVEFPKSLVSIGDSAFLACSGIRSIIIPENVTSIGDFVFESTHITKIYIESTKIKDIGMFAFSAYAQSTVITVKSEEIAALVRNSLWDADSATIIVEKPVDPVTVDKSAVTLYTGNYKNTTTVKATLNGITGKIKWTTSNKAVATVKNGKITAVGKGTAVIKVTVGANTAQVKVTVKNPTVTVVDGSKTVSSINVKKSKTVIYKVKVSPVKSKVSIVQDAKSKKTAKVTCKNNLLSVKGLKKGSTVIKIKCGAGVKKIKVTVK